MPFLGSQLVMAVHDKSMVPRGETKTRVASVTAAVCSPHLLRRSAIVRGTSGATSLLLRNNGAVASMCACYGCVATPVAVVVVVVPTSPPLLLANEERGAHSQRGHLRAAVCNWVVMSRWVARDRVAAACAATALRVIRQRPGTLTIR